MKSIFAKASDEFNLMIAINLEMELIKKFKDRLAGFKKVIEVIRKIENSTQV